MKSSTREFKFRTWSYLDKTFHYFDLHEGFPQGIAGGLSEAMQYTGFVDKNNVEIYEGDILAGDNTLNSEFITSMVVFKYGKFIEYKYGYNLDFLAENNYKLEKLERYSVIGNIFENAELLK